MQPERDTIEPPVTLEDESINTQVQTAKRIALSGASGLVGSALAFAIRARGDTVTQLVSRVAGRTVDEAQ